MTVLAPGLLSYHVSMSGRYFIADIGWPGTDHDTDPANVTVASFSCEHRSVTIQTLQLVDWGQDRSLPDRSSYRYSIVLDNGVQDDDVAQKVADAVFAGLVFCGDHHLLNPDELPMVVWVDDGDLTAAGEVSLTKVCKGDLWKLQRLSGSAHLVKQLMDDVWASLPFLVSQPLFDAVHFFVSSQQNLYMAGDTKFGVLAGELDKPVARQELARAENAVQNAFKAIEAIVGDPSKDNDKFERKLLTAGVDPKEMVGPTFHGHPVGVVETTKNKIRRISDIRDKRAAHGSTRSGAARSITYLEVLDAQECARHIIIRNLMTVVAPTLKLNCISRAKPKT